MARVVFGRAQHLEQARSALRTILLLSIALLDAEITMTIELMRYRRGFVKAQNETLARGRRTV